MEHTIPALVIAAIIVVGGVILAGVTNSSLDSVGLSWREMEALSEERLGTNLTVVSTDVTGGDQDVTVVLGNEGRTVIEEPSHMDLIIYNVSVLKGMANSFEVLMGMPYWGGVLLSGLVILFYTAVGGYLAVVWTGFVQANPTPSPLRDPRRCVP